MSAAAMAAGRTQPAISHAVGKLEAALGVRLLRRGPGGTELTPEGAILQRRAARMDAQLAAAAADVAGTLAAPAKTRRICAALTDTQLNTHIAIAQSGSAAAAARLLGVSEPGVHRAGRALEQALRATLYRRHAQRVSVNAAGLLFAQRASQARAEIIQAQDELAALRLGQGASLRIGLLPLSPQRQLARLIGNYAQATPSARINLEEAPHSALLAQLQFGTLDLIIGALRTSGVPDGCVEIPLYADPYVIAARRDHPLAAKTDLGFADLAAFPWIIPPAGLPRRAIIDAVLNRLAAPPPQIFETSSLPMILAMLAQSATITLLPHSQLAAEGVARELAVLPMAVPDSQRLVGYTMRANWLPTRAQDAFITQLKSFDFTV